MSLRVQESLPSMFDVQICYGQPLNKLFFPFLFWQKSVWFMTTDILVTSEHVYRHAFATLSFGCEIFIFLYVGMDALDIEKWRFVSDRWGCNQISQFITSRLSCTISMIPWLFTLSLSALERQFEWVQYFWDWFWLEEPHLCSLYHLYPISQGSHRTRKSA